MECVTEMENSVSQHKECVSELNGVRREVVRRAYQVNSQTQNFKVVKFLEKKDCVEKSTVQSY